MVEKIVDNIFGLDHKHICPSIDHSRIGIFLGGEIHECPRQEHIIDKLQIIVVTDHKAVEFDILPQQTHQVLAVDRTGDPVYSTVWDHHIADVRADTAMVAS